MTTSEPRVFNRQLALVCSQPLNSSEAGPPKRNTQHATSNADFLEFALEELDAMQQRVGELRFAIAEMTTLIKERLDRS